MRTYVQSLLTGSLTFSNLVKSIYLRSLKQNPTCITDDSNLRQVDHHERMWMASHGSNVLSASKHPQLQHSQWREGESRETETEPDSQITASIDCFPNRPRIVHLILSGNREWVSTGLKQMDQRYTIPSLQLPPPNQPEKLGQQQLLPAASVDSSTRTSHSLCYVERAGLPPQQW